MEYHGRCSCNRYRECRAARGAGVHFSKIVLSTSFLSGIYYVLVNALQAMGKGKHITPGLLCIPALFILESFFGADGIRLGQPGADVVSLILTTVLYAASSENPFRS